MVMLMFSTVALNYAQSARRAFVIIMDLKYFAPVVIQIYLEAHAIFVKRGLSTMNVVAMNK